MEAPELQPFEVTLAGPEGSYTLHYRSSDGLEGSIALVLAGVDMAWAVETIDRRANGAIILSGMTSGSKPIWDDQFWFELEVTPGAAEITYWGNQVIWRVDRQVQ